jgi:hypothetical protein
MLDFPAVTADYEREDHLLFNVLHHFAAAGVYRLLTKFADFETGEIPFPMTYDTLLGAGGFQPRPQQGPGRKSMTYEQLRRIIRDLESVGLVARDCGANSRQGQLRLRLPIRAEIAAERKKERERRIREQVSAQASKARKAS